MTRHELEQRIVGLNVWRRRDERAPHKPLLVLHVLGRVLRGEPRLASYGDLAPHLAELIVEFGLLHAFIQETPQTPDRELKLARRRQREVEDG